MWQGESNREESLSDPRWNRRRTNEGNKSHPVATPTPATIKDDRENIERTAEKKNTFPNVVFSDNSTRQEETSEKSIMETNTDNVNTTSRRKDQTKTSSSTQTEPKTQNTDTQTELSFKTKEIY